MSTPLATKAAVEPRDLLECEDLRPRQEGMVRPEHLARHAVRAAEVASVGDLDPQVAQRPGKRVDHGQLEEIGHEATDGRTVSRIRPAARRRWRGR